MKWFWGWMGQKAQQQQAQKARHIDQSFRKESIRVWRDSFNENVNIPNRHCKIGWVRLKGLI